MLGGRVPFKKPYEHVCRVDDDDEAVRKGIGWVFGLPSLIVQGVIDIGIVSTFGWFSANLWATVGVGAIGLAVLIWSFSIRRERLKLVRLARYLHRTLEHLRNGTSAVREALKEAKGDFEAYNQLYMAFNESAVNKIARYFEELIGERTVSCALRVAAPDRDGQIKLWTVSRSEEMCKDERQYLSQPFKLDEGIARHLRDKKNAGVFFIWDRKAAADAGLYQPSETDCLPDVKYLMAAPVNCVVNGEKRILGIIYIHTRRKYLKTIHAEHLMAFADALGHTLPMIARKPNQEQKEMESEASMEEK